MGDAGGARDRRQRAYESKCRLWSPVHVAGLGRSEWGREKVTIAGVPGLPRPAPGAAGANLWPGGAGRQRQGSVGGGAGRGRMHHGIEWVGGWVWQHLRQGRRGPQCAGGRRRGDGQLAGAGRGGQESHTTGRRCGVLGGREEAVRTLMGGSRPIKRAGLEGFWGCVCSVEGRQGHVVHLAWMALDCAAERGGAPMRGGTHPCAAGHTCMASREGGGVQEGAGPPRRQGAGRHRAWAGRYVVWTVARWREEGRARCGWLPRDWRRADRRRPAWGGRRKQHGEGVPRLAGLRERAAAHDARALVLASPGQQGASMHVCRAAVAKAAKAMAERRRAERGRAPLARRRKGGGSEGGGEGGGRATGKG